MPLRSSPKPNTSLPCFILMVVTSEPRLNDVTPLIHATRSPGRVVFLFLFFSAGKVGGVTSCPPLSPVPGQASALARQGCQAAIHHNGM